MTPREFSLLLLCGALFASTFPLIRLTAPVFGPLALMDIRVFLAAGLLALWAWISRQPLGFKRPLCDWLLLGGLNSALPFSLIAFAQLHVPSSTAAIFIATVPLFTLLIEALWFGQSFTPQKALGLTLGTSGVAVLSGWGGLTFTPVVLLALLALLLASLSYALSAMVMKTRFAHGSPLSVSTGNFLSAGILLLPLAAAMPPRSLPGLETVLALAVLAVLSTAVAWALFFGLVRRLGIGPTSSVSYLIPMFGVVFGVLFLSEPVGPSTLLGFVLVLGGVALVGEVRLGWSPKRHATTLLPSEQGGQA